MGPPSVENLVISRMATFCDMGYNHASHEAVVCTFDTDEINVCLSHLSIQYITPYELSNCKCIISDYVLENSVLGFLK